MIKKTILRRFIVCHILLLFFSSLNMLSAQTGPTDDWDGDGILNQSDLDDDNDGILDINENLVSSVNAIINGNFGTNGTTGGNLTGWTTNGAGTSSLTNWAAESGGAVSYMDGAEGLNLSQSNVPLKTASTPAFATFSVKVLSVNAFGTSINQGWGKMDFYLETTTGLVRIFRVSNPLTTTLASPTTNIELIDSSLVLSLAINGDYISRSFATGSYFTITVNINTANLASSGLVLVQRKNGAVSGPNGQIGADDFIIDDVSYTYQTGVDTDLDGIPNYFDLDSDGDGCPDATEGSAAFTSSALVASTINGGNAGTTYNGYAGPVNLNLGNTIDANGIPTIANGGQNVGSSQIISPDIDGDGLGNTCDLVDNRPDTDGDGIKDAEDIDDDNDGIVDAVESPSCFYTTTEAEVISTVKTSLANDDGTNVDLPFMHDGVTTSVAASNNTISINQAVNGATIYTIEYPTPIKLTSITHNGTTFGTSATATVQGSNDNFAWTDLMTVATAAIAATKTFTLNNNPGNYKYYRIVKVAGTSTPAITTYELSGVQNTVGYIPSAHPKPTCSTDTDNDGIVNHLDLDSDGDGCSDLTEAGVSPITDIFTPSNGSIFGISNPTNSQLNPSGTDNNNDGLNDSVDTNQDGITEYTSTYNQYAIDSGINACTDTDGDSIRDITDIDDDNDGILDRVECPALTTNLASNGGFSAAAASLPNWYMGLANSPLPIAEPFTPTVNNITKTGNVYNYGFGAGLPSNSSLTGGLFDQIDGVNTATGVQYALQEQDPQRPLVSNIAVPLVAGATYKYTFDLSNRATVGSANKYIVLLYNADTKTPEKIISSGTLNTLPGTSSNPTYKNFTGNFIPQSSGNYYLLFYPSISGGLADDFVVDRVAVVGSGTALCDTDGDGIPNHLDTDSDNDGCSDAREAGVIDYIIANGGTYSSGTLNNPTSSSSPEVTVGNNTPANYGTNGFYTAIESNDTLSATYNGMYTYSNAINAAIASCTLFCYRPAVLSGTVLSTPQGITSLHRAGVDADNWPMVRKGAWTALEAKTKGFVPNRLTLAQINLIPAGDLREGMMVYNISSDCLYINTDGTPTGWKCFNTQACPD